MPGQEGYEHVADLKRLRRLSDAFFANSHTYVCSNKAPNASAMLAFSGVSFLPLIILSARLFYIPLLSPDLCEGRGQFCFIRRRQGTVCFTTQIIKKHHPVPKGTLPQRRYLARAKPEPYVPLREVRTGVFPVEQGGAFYFENV